MSMFSPGRKTEPAMPAIESEKPPVVPPAPVATPTIAPSATASHNPISNSGSGGGVLSSGVSITGSLSFRNELLIDGEVEGEINSTGQLTIGKNARIRGEIQTKSVVVDGTVEGNITAGERCELRSGCTVHGDIESPRLVVDEQATFIGSAKISSPRKSLT
ncbi:MAG: polymer-forming cytoskeletal protein [Verrucomicrobiota bacterium]